MRNISNSELFLANEVDLAMFTTLGDEDLKSIGVISYRARRAMLHSIDGKLILKPCFFLRITYIPLTCVTFSLELKSQPIYCPVEDYFRLNPF